MNVFILFRLYISATSSDTVNNVKSSFLSIKDAFVMPSCMNNVTLLINDDSPEKQKDKDWLRDELNSLNEYGITTQVYETAQVGSAMALYNLRRAFINIASDDDIAITLDQDDRFTRDALQSICQHFEQENADIVISNLLQNDPDDYSLLLLNGALHNDFVSGSKQLEYADSLCWTKSYRKRVLKQHLDDLRNSMGGEEKLANFYCKYKAYDDFIDFGMLLYKDLIISRNQVATHIYQKHATSITASPRLEDFKVTRSKCLLAVINLVYHIDKNKLCENATLLLFNYINIKITAIENILDTYRSKFDNGYTIYAEIAASTHPSYFIRKFTRMAFEGDKLTKDNFIRLIKNSNALEKTFDINLNNARYVLQKECGEIKKEIGLTPSDTDSKKKDNFINFKKSSKSLRRKKAWTVGLGITLVIVLCIIVVFTYNKRMDMDTCMALVTILLGLLTVLINAFVETCDAINHEENMRELYCSEFKELIRHLQAGCKVLIRLKKELDLDTSCLPSSIHFRNLCVPDSSHLLSAEIIKFAPSDCMEDISRIKVNIRNINNSAIYMEQYVTSPTYDAETMKNLIDWELSRYLGYILTFEYIQQSGKFKFPNDEERDIYLEKDNVRHKLSKLFLGYPAEERIKKVNTYLEAYKNDRCEERAVIMEVR